MRYAVFIDRFGRAWTGPFPFNLTTVSAQSKRAIPRVIPHKSGIVFTSVPLHSNVANWGALAGVYMILERKKPAYIGIATDSVFDRLKRHVAGKGNKLAGPVADDPAYEFVYWLCDGQSAKQIESHILVNEKPRFNMRCEYVNYIENITIH